MGILDLIFPKSCLECGSEGLYLCPNCISKVKTPRPICPFCLRFSLYGRAHSRCKSSVALDGLTCLWKYEGVTRRAILRLKYNFALEISNELSNYSFRKLQVDNPIFLKNVILVPIPLYWYRENWRGFNQAEALGSKIATLLGWGFEPALLVRKGFRPPQTGLARADRLENTTGVFDVSVDFIKTLPSFKIVLFDDVWTTGSTLKEAAKALKQKGAKKVWGLTLAR